MLTYNDVRLRQEWHMVIIQSRDNKRRIWQIRSSRIVDPCAETITVFLISTCEFKDEKNLNEIQARAGIRWVVRTVILATRDAGDRGHWSPVLPKEVQRWGGACS